MYTLGDIYHRLNAGTAGVKRSSAFVDPDSGPAPTMATVDEIMATAPAVDEANGASAADVAEGKTFWGLTSGEWGIQIGERVPDSEDSAYPAPVARTGQTVIYYPRDDGQLQMGVEWPVPRFTDNLNGTITDNLTGLIWLKNANPFGARLWAMALTDCNTLNSGEAGLTDGSVEGDWRLPNIRELFSLIDSGQSSVALPSGHPFSDVQGVVYWSSTTYDSAESPQDYAWCVDMESGMIFFIYPKTKEHNVWPVRGGQ
jgi:hypothetical protein